jgi:diaminohydroxyphosphoribosylaminopyrimidine deaminase/5-amino-6-(5-phosphoribosylamino)uracil reductase
LRDAWTGLGAKLLEVRVFQGQLDMVAVLEILGVEGLTRVFCEGGGAVAAALLKADLADRVAVFTAGLGIGAEGLPSLGAMGLTRLSMAQRFKVVSTSQLGPDTLTQWERALTV